MTRNLMLTSLPAYRSPAHPLKGALSALLFVLLCSGLLGGTAMAADVDGKNWNDAYDGHFKKYARRYFGPHFDWRWFKAQAIAESHLRPAAASEAGAMGIMQLLPSTFRDIRKKKPHFGDLSSSQWNIAAGVYYDRQLFRKWRGLPEQERLYLTLASYNAGYARVRSAYNKVLGTEKSWERIKAYLPGETRAYVARIRTLMHEQPTTSRRLQLAYLFDT